MSAQANEPAGSEPILAGFYPDPSICRVGDEYFLANSSFEYRPGVPLWRSTDLLHWTHAGHALTRGDQFSHARRDSGGIYAPTLRHHDGRFWMITTDVDADNGQTVVSAPRIEGPWTPAVSLPSLRGIDPDLAWGPDGTCYVTYCSYSGAAPAIAQVRVDLERGIVEEEPRGLWSGTGLAHPEGPHLYQRGRWWYLMIAEGGTECGHAVSVARGSSPEGPFEPCPANPILSHRSLTHPVQNTGHADLVQTTDGEWAMVYLGVRPRGFTPMFHVNGRETFLAGIDWIDDWPVVDEARYRVDRADTAFVDDFTDSALDGRWVSSGGSLEEFVSIDAGGGALLTPLAARQDAPSLLSVRARDPHWRFEATVDSSAGRPAVRLRLDDRHWYEIRLEGDRAVAEMQIGDIRQRFVDDRAVDGADVDLVVASVPPTADGPDDILLGIADAHSERTVARADGRYLSTEVAGGFTGRVLGLHAVTGAPRVRSARYTTDA